MPGRFQEAFVLVILGRVGRWGRWGRFRGFRVPPGLLASLPTWKVSISRPQRNDKLTAYTG